MVTMLRRSPLPAILVAFVLAIPAVAGEGFAGLPSSLDRGQLDFLRERSRSGDAAMQCLYGLALLNGSAGFTDREEGAEWLRQSAEGGDERGALEYGKMLSSGIHGEKDPAASLRWLLPAAERGVAEAAYYAGAAILTGDTVDRDPEEGERWMRRAAESGLAMAQADMGVAYYAGLGGLRQDYREALRWFTLSAKQGNGDSCNKLGVMYLHGQGVRTDPERATLWFAMGANLGNQFAQFNLANIYMNGLWLPRDYARAAHWFQEAASRGNVDALYFLGRLSAEGLGVRKDVDTARDLLNRAERSGHADAGRLLQQLYQAEDDPVSPPSPERVKAADLLQKAVHSLANPVEGGRDVLLEVGWTVRISPSSDGAAVFLTLPGCPAVIACELAPSLAGREVAAGATLIGVAGPSTGLPGFITLKEVRVAEAEEEDDLERGEQPADSGDADA